MRKFWSWLRQVILVLIVVVAPVALVFCAYVAWSMSLPWSLVFCFQGRFEHLPESDEALEAAIREVERVIDSSVSVSRPDADGTLLVQFGTGGSLWNRPPLPDLDRLCKENGYDGATRPFVPIDCVTGQPVQQQH